MKLYCTGPERWNIELDDGTVKSGFRNYLEVWKWLQRFKAQLGDLL